MVRIVSCSVIPAARLYFRVDFDTGATLEDVLKKYLR